MSRMSHFFRKNTLRSFALMLLETSAIAKPTITKIAGSDGDVYIIQGEKAVEVHLGEQLQPIQRQVNFHSAMLTSPKRFSTQDQAFAYCASLRFNGYSEWRLPGELELQYLAAVDMEHAPDWPSDAQILWRQHFFYPLGFEEDLQLWDEVHKQHLYECVRNGKTGLCPMIAAQNIAQRISGMFAVAATTISKRWRDNAPIFGSCIRGRDQEIAKFLWRLEPGSRWAECTKAPGSSRSFYRSRALCQGLNPPH